MTTLLNNRYQIIRVLGHGGFGETFLAEDTHMPSRRRCVIKQLKPVTNDPQMYQLVQQRFQREAATLEHLGEDSDQIPHLYAYFSENGQFYLVQEWIPGQTLTEKVQAAGPLNESAVKEILVSLLPVLDYVHSQGIIHRDIKPDNIILRQSNGKPVLIDFGAVKETMVAANNYQANPNQSIVIGTPGFMSTEQGAGRPVYASDLYSLGLTTIYLLTGRQPSELQTNPQTGELLWRQYAPNVSAIAAVLDRAIHPNASDRYPTANKMLEALQSVASVPATHRTSTQATLVVSPPVARSNQPTPVNSPQTGPVINPPIRQGNRQALVLGGVLAGGLISAFVVVGLLRQSPQPSPEPPVAQATPSSESRPPVSEPADDSTAPATVQQSVPPVVSVPQDRAQNTQIPTPLTSPQDNEPQEEASPSVTTTLLPEEPAPQEEATPPVATTPLPDNTNENSSPVTATSRSVPGFPTGTPESNVRAALGSPAKISKGLWNTRAFLYEVVPNEIDVGYLFDRNTGVLRQTEVSFAQSVEPEVMETTLQQLLGNRASSDINQGLQQVYERRSNHYAFNTGGLRGVVQRNNRDRIYIGVWDADLH